jgi:hypothetical protein
MIPDYSSMPPERALPQMVDDLHTIAELQEQHRIYFANGTRLPNQLFHLVAMVEYLVNLAKSQQEEIVALKEKVARRERGL